jgi:hypothetical protein
MFSTKGGIMTNSQNAVRRTHEDYLSELVDMARQIEDMKDMANKLPEQSSVRATLLRYIEDLEEQLIAHSKKIREGGLKLMREVIAA